jgi:glycerophosphoryl diester phosphodiesterase
MLILGHRGDRKKFPDNTLEGLQSAFDRGADGVEFDVHWQKDKGVYLNHPYIHKENKDFPLLGQVLEKFGNKGRLEIEIKTPDIEAAIAVADLIKQHQPQDFEVTSSIYPLLRSIREILPEAEVGLIANSLPQNWWTEEFGNYFLESYLKLTGAQHLHLGGIKGFWTKNRINWFHEKDYQVSAHLFSAEKAEYDKAVLLGFDSCTADDLDIIQVRRE